MYFKIHESYRRVVAVCDSDLIGKKFEEGKMQLEVRENFYKDEEIDFENAIEFFKKEIVEDATFNIVGAESIKAAKESGVISDGNVGEVAGIPFALRFV